MMNKLFKTLGGHDPKTTKQGEKIVEELNNFVDSLNLDPRDRLILAEMILIERDRAITHILASIVAGCKDPVKVVTCLYASLTKTTNTCYELVMKDKEKVLKYAIATKEPSGWHIIDGPVADIKICYNRIGKEGMSIVQILDESPTLRRITELWSWGQVANIWGWKKVL